MVRQLTISPQKLWTKPLMKEVHYQLTIFQGQTIRQKGSRPAQSREEVDGQSSTQQQAVMQNMTVNLTPMESRKWKPRWCRPDSTFVCESEKHAIRQKMQSKVPAGRHPFRCHPALCLVKEIHEWCMAEVQKVQNKNLFCWAFGCDICHQMVRVNVETMVCCSDLILQERLRLALGLQFTDLLYPVNLHLRASSFFYGLLPCFKKHQ